MKFKTKKELIGKMNELFFSKLNFETRIGGGDLEWEKYSFSSLYSVNPKDLEKKELVFQLYLSNKQNYGTVRVNLHDLATGSTEYNLPIFNVLNE